MNNHRPGRFFSRRIAQGASLVEFMIVIPLLLILVMGLAEMGRLLYQQNTLTKTVAVGARYLARQADLLQQNNCLPREVNRWQEVQQEAAHLMVCGQVSGCSGQTPIVPGLIPADVQIATPFLLEEEVNGKDVKVCVLTVQVQTAFQPLLGDSLVPILRIPAPQLTARMEERYSGN